MSLAKLSTLTVLAGALLLCPAESAFAEVNFVAPGIAGSVSNLAVDGKVYNVTFVASVTHAEWANQLDFHTEAEAHAAIYALAAEFNAAGVTATQFIVSSGPINVTTSTVWYAANATTLFGESLIKVGSTWQLASVSGGATAPINNSKPIALDFTLVPTWTDLGSGLAGVSGIPSLVGAGTLVAGSAGSLTLSSANPSSPAVLFVSSANTPTPFMGGTLITVPVALVVNLNTNGSGGFSLPFNWPAGAPAGTSLYMQAAILDPVGPLGVALSNAVRAVTP